MILKYEAYELKGTTVFERVEFKAPFKPSVTYEQEACFIYSLEGDGMLYGGLEQENVQSNESILMKCGSFLNHWKSSKRNKPCEVIAIHFTPEVLGFIYEHKIPEFLNDKRVKSNKIFTRVPHEKIIDEYIKGLVFYFDNPTLINDDLIVLKIKELILLLYNINHTGIRELMASLFDPVLLSFKSIIQAQLFEDLEIKDYAALTSMSLSTFKRRFKQVFNDTPARYIINKRLEKAAGLLKFTDKRVTDVCFECGFSSLSTFSRSFSKKYQVVPSDYKQSS